MAIFGFLVTPFGVLAQNDTETPEQEVEVPAINLPSFDLSGLSVIERELSSIDGQVFVAQADVNNTPSVTTQTATTNNQPTEYQLIVGTSPTTAITNVSALLSGYLDPRGEVTDSYFVYGKTTAMNQSTQTVRRSTAGLIQIPVDNLDPGTRYYAQHCASNILREECGIVVSFITKTGPGAAAAVDGASDTALENEATIEYFEVIIPVPSSFVSLAIQNGVSAMQTGDVLTYEITYDNQSDETLRDGILYVELPQDLNFLDTTRGDYSPTDHAISYEFGTIAIRESGTIFVTMQLPQYEDDRVPVVATARLVHQNPDNGAREGATAYDVDTRYHTLAEERQDALAASAFGAFGGTTPLVITLLAIAAVLTLVYMMQSMGLVTGPRVVYKTVRVPQPAPAPAYAAVSVNRLSDMDVIPHPPALVDEVHEPEVYSESYQGHLGQ